MWKARCGGNISASFFSTIERLHIAQQDLHKHEMLFNRKVWNKLPQLLSGHDLGAKVKRTMTGPKSRWKHMLMQKWKQRHPQSTLAIRYLLDRESTSSQHVSIPYHLELCVQMGWWLQHVTIASVSLLFQSRGPSVPRRWVEWWGRGRWWYSIKSKLQLYLKCFRCKREPSSKWIEMIHPQT